MTKQKKISITYVSIHTSYLDSEKDEAQAQFDKVVRYIWNHIAPASAHTIGKPPAAE